MNEKTIEIIMDMMKNLDKLESEGENIVPKTQELFDYIEKNNKTNKSTKEVVRLLILKHGLQKGGVIYNLKLEE